MIYHITLTKTVGIYGTDEQGNPWSTFTFVGDGSVSCDECGQSITGGWERGRYGEEQFHVCSSHVHITQGETNNGDNSVS